MSRTYYESIEKMVETIGEEEFETLLEERKVWAVGSEAYWEGEWKRREVFCRVARSSALWRCWRGIIWWYVNAKESFVPHKFYVKD